MKQKIINLLLVLMMGATMFSARPVYAAGDTPIDLSLDRNGNQISDAVEDELATLQALPEDQQIAEMERFVSKLPYTAETFALQERAQELSMSLSTAKPEEAQAILEELAKISSQLDEDPVIQKVQSDILTLTGIGIDDGTTPSLSVAFSSLRKGDILARRSGLFVAWPWAMWYEHTGNYDNNGLVLESMSRWVYPAGGVRLHPLSEWQTRGIYVALARNKFASATDMAHAVDWAKDKYGINGRTPYNYFFPDKWTDASLYCSQLTWKIHGHLGFDLDSNDGGYLFWAFIKFRGAWILGILIPAVAPDEVMLYPNINIYSKGWN